MLDCRLIVFQMLLHDIHDTPMMKERAFAISPGLYTMVAIEKTQVMSCAMYCHVLYYVLTWLVLCTGRSYTINWQVLYYVLACLVLCTGMSCTMYLQVLYYVLAGLRLSTRRS